jgi:hypothetical protein
MRASTPRHVALGTAWLLVVAAMGCDSTPTSNLSPTANRAADRHEQAVRYSEQRARKNREAERKAMKRKHLTPLPR